MTHRPGWSRREVLRTALGAGVLAASGSSLVGGCSRTRWQAETFIGRAKGYTADITSVILSGLRELRLGRAEINGKRILLKPNLVEPLEGAEHVNTHPAVVRAAAEAFLSLGASRVLVGEGPGHCRDTMLVLEVSGMDEALREDRIPFVDLNYDDVWKIQNAAGFTELSSFRFPATLRQVDWVVSLAKMKTHHWAGVTLSMKNLFGLMPGMFYGWPKNVLHWEGIDKCILDINATVRPALAIVDGIVGMEGDGPIMGEPRHAGVLVMGRNLPAVDATSARIMGIQPYHVRHLVASACWLGPIGESRIHQRGETISSVRADFSLLETIPAQKGIRLPS